MKAFVLAAGFGKRLLPLTEVLPKPLVPIVNVPSICYTIMLIKEAGITEAVINLHHGAQQIKDFLIENDNFGLRMHFSLEEEILGTGGGIKNCEAILSDDDFMLINSDVLCDFYLPELIEYYMRHRPAGVLLLHRKKDSYKYGTIGIYDNRITDINSMLGTGDSSDFVYTGAAVFSPAIFGYLAEGFSSIVETGFMGLIKKHELLYYENNKSWRDIGSPVSYLKANLELAASGDEFADRMRRSCGMEMEPIPDNLLKPETARIINSVIGENVNLGRNAIVENSVILPGTVIGDDKHIKNSIMGQGILMETQ